MEAELYIVFSSTGRSVRVSASEMADLETSGLRFQDNEAQPAETLPLPSGHPDIPVYRCRLKGAASAPEQRAILATEGLMSYLPRAVYESDRGAWVVYTPSGNWPVSPGDWLTLDHAFRPVARYTESEFFARYEVDWGRREATSRPATAAQ